MSKQLNAVFLKPWFIVWASPNTALGLLVGLVGVCSGGRAQFRSGCVEFHGGFVTWILRRTLLGRDAMAMTLGHAILGQSEAALDIARSHEQIHVGQYERWGPLFLFAYLGSSAWLWAIGKDAYRDNPFEIEAYAKDRMDPGSSRHC